MPFSFPTPKTVLKNLRYLGEVAIIYPLYVVAVALPLDAASWLGGFLARLIGPWLEFNSTAIRNIERAMPEKTFAERRTLVTQMWDNLGRTLAEYTHLGELWDKGRIEVVGQDILKTAVAAKGSVILVGGHLANWEISPVTAAGCGLPLAVAYRPPNNRMVGKLLNFERRRGVSLFLMPKGAEGARGLLRHLAKGGSLGLLVDQKMNDGISVPFFGIPAMTASAVAKIAIKTRLPLIPLRSERIKGAHFRATFSPPMSVPDSDSGREGELQLMTELNAMLEDWIRAKPAHWLWLHRRWEK